MAGLKWPPEMYPKASIAAVTARPPARAPGSGLDCGRVKSGTPSPASTRNSVPNASAPSLDRSPGRTPLSPAGCRWSVGGTDTGVLMAGKILCFGQRGTPLTSEAGPRSLAAKSGRLLNPSLSSDDPGPGIESWLSQQGKFACMSNDPGAVPSPESRIHGCLLGGALGDSLGYAVEFDQIDEIRRRFGAAGLRDFSMLDGGTHFSDDTQMTLYTVDGIVEALEWANSGVGADANACVWLAYLRWLDTQGVPVPESAPRPQPRWIDGQEVLRHRRAPGNACLSGLATGEMGTVFRQVNPDSKGCGTVMRSAPFGLVPHIPADAVYKLSADAASLTHGHPCARQSAGVFSLLIHSLVQDGSLAEAAQDALARVLADDEAAPELRERLEAAVRLAGEAGAASVLSPEDLVRELGEGWVAEEALA